MYLFILEHIHGMYTVFDISKYMHLGYDMVMTGIYWSDFYTRYIMILYIYTVCNLFRMRYAEYILKLQNLYIFYTTYILPGLVDVLAIYLGYDNIGDILLQTTPAASPQPPPPPPFPALAETLPSSRGPPQPRRPPLRRAARRRARARAPRPPPPAAREQPHPFVFYV